MQIQIFKFANHITWGPNGNCSGLYARIIWYLYWIILFGFSFVLHLQLQYIDSIHFGSKLRMRIFFGMVIPATFLPSWLHTHTQSPELPAPPQILSLRIAEGVFGVDVSFTLCRSLSLVPSMILPSALVTYWRRVCIMRCLSWQWHSVVALVNYYNSLVWICGLELELAFLSPSNPKISKQGGLELVRCI